METGKKAEDGRERFGAEGRVVVYKWAGINILEAAIGPWCTKHGQVGQVGGLPLLYHKTPGKPNFWPRGARDMRLKNATRKSDRQCYDICCTMVFFPVVGLFDYVHITSTHTVVS